jgi:hypothetical protein
LFSQSPATEALPTPIANDQHTDFFTAGHEYSKQPQAGPEAGIKGGPLSTSTGLPLITPSEPHSPAWGRKNAFNQPKSRAGELPPASVLKHEHDQEESPQSRSGATVLERMESSDRLIKEAPWSIQPSEQGNPGLRNAVHAACRCDDTMEKTWVSPSRGLVVCRC